MPAGNVSITVEDGSLGIVEQSNTANAKIGTAAGGTIGQVLVFGKPSEARTTLLAGRMLEEVLHTLDTAGGPVYAVRVAGGVAGAAVGSMAHQGTGPNTGVAATGTPLADYALVIDIVAGGALGTGTVRFSVDGGDTWSPIYTLAASMTQLVAETGLTITFAVATYVAGDQYSQAFNGPRYLASDVGTAMDAITAHAADIREVHIVGSAGDPTDTAADQLTAHVAFAAAVDTKLTAAEAGKKPITAIIEVPPVADTDIQAHAAFNAQSSSRQVWVVGAAERSVGANARQHQRHAGGAFSARLAKTALGRSPGVPADGSLKGVTRLYRDETSAAISLDDLRLVTLRTLPHFPGYFITTGRTRAAPGSDFGHIPARRVMDEAIVQVTKVMSGYLNVDVRITSAGLIDDRDAVAIDAALVGALRAALVDPNHVSSATAAVDRTTNILSTGIYPVAIRIVPKGYARAIEATIGFLNPALRAQAN